MRNPNPPGWKEMSREDRKAWIAARTAKNIRRKRFLAKEARRQAYFNQSVT